MHRRNLLKSAASVAAAAGTFSVATAAEKPPVTNSSSWAGMSFVQTRDGTRLFWKEWGEGEPLLFFNSLGLSSQMWDYQLPVFAEAGFRCVAFDRRGPGRSDIPAKGYDYDTLADDAATVINALKLNGLTLVGHSMGCSEIVRYLTRHGGARVRRIVLLSPTTPFLLKTADNPSGIPEAGFEALRTQWKKDFPKWISDNTDPFFTPQTSPALMQWGKSQLMKMSLPVQLACNIALTRTDFRAELKKISVPALIVHGDKDASAPLTLTGKPTAALIPNCQLKIYEGAPHGLMYTHAEKLHADMLQFMQTT